MVLKMQEHNFIFKFKLNPDYDLETHLDALCEAGCDDSLVGCGCDGWLTMDFTREADNLKAAVESAIHEVRTVIGTTFIEIEYSPKNFWDRDLEDIESDFLPVGKKITDMPIQYSIDGMPLGNKHGKKMKP